jgi:hypothetical protein
MYVLPQIHAVAGGLGTLFWLLMITGFGLGFYLAERNVASCLPKLFRLADDRILPRY